MPRNRPEEAAGAELASGLGHPSGAAQKGTSGDFWTNGTRSGTMDKQCECKFVGVGLAMDNRKTEEQTND